MTIKIPTKLPTKLFKMSIATKLILATMVLVLLTILPISYQNSRYFEDELKNREQDINLATASARANETDNVLRSLLEKSRSIGTLYMMSLENKTTDLTQTAGALLDNDRDIFSVDVYGVGSTNGASDFKLEKTLTKKSMVKDMGADDSVVDRIRSGNPFPLASVAQGNIEVMSAIKGSNSPLMAIGIPLSKNEIGRIDRIVVTYFELAGLQHAFATKSARTVFLIDARGNVLAHPDEKLVLSGMNLRNQAVVARAVSETNTRSQFPFKDGQADWWGAYSRTSMGPIVVSLVSNDHVVAPARQARRQSTFMAGTALSLSIFIVFLLSMNFSSPIEKLALFIEEVANGNLNVSAGKAVRRGDELGKLANAFDDMVAGLRERAKAYAVMRQNLGSQVVETLMSMSDEELGGQRKPVAVLFSDLRDFTKFSEGHSPEDVVSMLNEYFNVMVKVINKHGGWLDKFIGDAIMAVWGVPHSKEGDTHRAALAAIDMRLALKELNDLRISRGMHPIKIGIGLHCGEAIVGKIGATERANLTVIGDTVNQASRIEASTKAFGTDCLLSQEMAEALGTGFWIESAGSAEVKGKSEALKLYKLRGTIATDGTKTEVATPYSAYTPEAADKVKVA